MDLKEKCMNTEVKLMVGNIESLKVISDMLDVCYERPEKHITEALKLITEFRR
jgi:hypothetical protein